MRGDVIRYGPQNLLPGQLAYDKRYNMLFCGGDGRSKYGLPIKETYVESGILRMKYVNLTSKGLPTEIYFIEDYSGQVNNILFGILVVSSIVIHFSPAEYGKWTVSEPIKTSGDVLIFYV